MKVYSNIFSNTDKFVSGSNVKLFYSGLFFKNLDIRKVLTNAETADDVFFYYSYSKRNDADVYKVKMDLSELGYTVEIPLLNFPKLYFYLESANKKDNNRGHWYSLEIEEMPESLLKMKENVLPKKLSTFDLFRQNIKYGFNKVVSKLNRLNELNTATKENADI